MAKKQPKVQLPAAPDALTELLGVGKVNDLSSITDICAEAMSAVIERRVSTNQSRELRQWAELMFTCVQVDKGLSNEGDVNFITQLVNIEATKTLSDTAPQVIAATATAPPKLPEPVAVVEESTQATYSWAEEGDDWDFLLQATA